MYNEEEFSRKVQEILERSKKEAEEITEIIRMRSIKKVCPNATPEEIQEIKDKLGW